MPAVMCRTGATGRRSPPLAQVAWLHWKWRNFWNRRTNSNAARALKPVRTDRYSFRRRRMPQTTCPHVKEIREVKPSGKGCKECLEMGDTWVHLRECLVCGHVGCCDSSKNKHATKHFHQTKHPVMQSFEPDENWRWCYVDEIFLS